MQFDCESIQSFTERYKSIEAWLQQRSMFSIKKRIENYYEDTINGIEGDKDALEMELHGVRYIYNVLNGFASNFVWLFLSGFIGVLIGIVKPEANLLNIRLIGLIFIAILLCQWFFLRNANTAYEEMEVVKAELEKINNPVQPNPEKINNPAQSNLEKISIRIYKRSSVRRSIFGR